MITTIVLCVALGANGLPEPASPQPAAAGPQAPMGSVELLKQAKATFDYGSYLQCASLTERLLSGGELERAADQIEAYRLLGLSRYYLHQPGEAHRAFLNLLSLDPDFQLDPFYVPPPAVALFESVRAQNQALLQPIRDRRRAAREELRLEEEARQKLLAQAGTPAAPARIVREQIERRNPALALLPFGVGQFQNGDSRLGIVLASTEAATALASVAGYAWFQGHRLPDGNFDPSLQGSAIAARAVQIGSGAAFFGIWALGIGEAFYHFNATVIVRTEATGAPGQPTPAAVSSPPRGGSNQDPPAEVPSSLFQAAIAPLPGGLAGSFSVRY